MDPGVPLVVPEVNPAAIGRHRGIVANPNCVAIPLSIVLAPLHRSYGVRHVTAATYQAATGAGLGLADELESQARDAAAGIAPTARVYPHVLHGNVVPGGWTMQGDDTEEEVKVIAETRRVLDAPELRMSVTTVRVPVAIGHSAAVWVELEHPRIPTTYARCCAKSPGIVIVDDPATSATRRHDRSRGATPSRSDGSVGIPDASMASRSSSAPTTFARAPPPTRCKSRSCCFASLDSTADGSPGHAPRGALNSANGGDDRRGPRAPRAGSRVHRMPAAPHPHPGRSGYGPVTARVMAVGEAPGESEDREGKPFVGAAGRLLTSLLESVGLDRRDIYITNIVKCRPPRNRDPEPLEVECLQPLPR